MPLDFPTSPNPGDIYTLGTRSWVWTGDAWKLLATSSINNTPIGNAAANTGAFSSVTSLGDITAVGNVSGSFFIGNGSALTGITSSSDAIQSGTSNVSVISAGGNVAVGIDGTANIAIFSTGGANVTGFVTATGNITGGNITTLGQIDATGNVTGANVTGGNVITTGAVTSASLAVSGLANLVGTTSAIGVLFSGARERVSLTGSAATGNLSVNLSTAPIFWYNTTATGNFVINLNAGTGNQLNSLLDIGEACTYVVIVQNGGTPYYATAIQIDGTTSNVTTRWQGGSAPSAGNANGLDVYTFSAIKTANATYTVLASLTQFAS